MAKSLPIQWRLTLFNALAIGAILLVLGFALFFFLRGALLAGVENTARGRAVTAARTIRSGDALSQDDLERLTLDGVFVLIRDEQGKVVSKTVNLASRNNDTIWRKALVSGRATGGTASLSTAAPDYVYAVPVRLPGGARRVVEAGKPYKTASATIKILATILATGILIALVVSTIGAYLLARAALSPVDRIVYSARRITESDLGDRLPVAHPKDKIGRLATTINDLLARLEAAFARREEALTRQKRFTADAGHELRTPLTSIGGYAQMLEEGGAEDPQIIQEGIAAIRRESERMRVLVESLLFLARGDEEAPLDLEAHDLRAIASEAVQTARPGAGGKILIECIVSEEEVTAIFDRARVLQVAFILLDNAVKYTPEGGRVEVTTRSFEDRVELEVTDTGVGITDEQLPHVFKRFYRGDPARTEGGAGLGLSIAWQIAEAHGGAMSVRSEVGEGSTFTLQLPKVAFGNDRSPPVNGHSPVS